VRTLAAALALLLSAGSAWADPPIEFALRLPAQAVVLVAKGLSELPYKDASPVLDEIQRQVNDQIAASQQTPPEPPK